MSAAKVELLLCLSDTSDVRAREAASFEYNAKGRNGKRFRRCANEGDVAVAAE
jgi:hypothetical protein